MAVREWVKTQKIYCDRVGQDVFLLEERVYPDKLLPDVGEPYIVRQKKCSNWLDCNLNGYPCCWSGINPDYDPFEDAAGQTR